jgi:hypothetical protein
MSTDEQHAYWNEHAYDWTALLSETELAALDACILRANVWLDDCHINSVRRFKRPNIKPSPARARRELLATRARAQPTTRPKGRPRQLSERTPNSVIVTELKDLDPARAKRLATYSVSSVEKKVESLDAQLRPGFMHVHPLTDNDRRRIVNQRDRLLVGEAYVEAKEYLRRLEHAQAGWAPVLQHLADIGRQTSNALIQHRTKLKEADSRITHLTANPEGLPMAQAAKLLTSERRDALKAQWDKRRCAQALIELHELRKLALAQARASVKHEIEHFARPEECGGNILKVGWLGLLHGKALTYALDEEQEIAKRWRLDADTLWFTGTRALSIEPSHYYTHVGQWWSWRVRNAQVWDALMAEAQATRTTAKPILAQLSEMQAPHERPQTPPDPEVQARIKAVLDDWDK